MSNSGKKILLVEDEAIIALVEKKTLEKYGYKISHVYSGEEAVDIIKAGAEIDLVLIDIDLGSGIDGTVAAERILDVKEIPLVFLSSHTEPEVVEKTEGITSYGYVVKNSGETVLIASVRMAFKLFEARSREKMARKLMETRLALIEYSHDHSLRDLINKTLDMVSEYVQSPIGFYHFLESDQKTLRLQQWSTRTLNDFCSTEGVKSHYSVDEAGVWVDCIHQRKAVIHNDYSSLPHRKGMPDGHAEVIRELLVPVMRNDRIVSIVGVGNKSSDYTDEDVVIVSYLADVTWQIIEQKRTDEELRNSRAELIEGQILAGFGNWKYDPKEKLSSWSEGMFNIWGLDNRREPLQIDELLTYIHPEDRQRLFSAMNKSLEKGILTEGEIRICRPDGEIRTVMSKCEPVFDESGNILFLRGTNHDITEQKHSEQALHENEKLFRDFFEQHSAVKLLIDPADGRIIDANLAASAYYGWTRDQLRQMYIQDVNTLPASEIDREMKKAAENKKVFFEFRHRRADGSIRDVEVYSSKIEVKGRALLHSIIHDITDRKFADKALQERKLYLRSIIETTPDGFLTVNSDKRICDVNDAYCRMSGYSKDELNGMYIFDLDCIEDPQATDERMKRITENGFEIFETKHRRKNGTVFDLEISVGRISLESVRFVCFCRDISERKAAEEKSCNLIKEKELILKEVHHRIKNNMNIIGGLIYLKIDSSENSDAGQILREVGGHIDSMLLLYDRLYRNEQFSEISMAEYLPDLVSEIVGSYPESGKVAVQCYTDDFMLGVKEIVPFGIIINELISNIMKYAFQQRENGVIRISVSNNESEVQAVIEDNGIGLPDNINMDNSTGFGLQLVKMLADQLKGNLTVERVEGTRFILVFKI